MSATRQAECYSLLITGQVLQDASTGNFTFVNIIENLSTPKEMLGQILGVETHSYWSFSVDLVGKAIDVRVEVAPCGGGDSFYSDTASVTVSPTAGAPGTRTVRGHVRAQGFKLPDKFGDYLVRMNWRNGEDSEWQVEPAHWYLGLVETPA